MRYVTNWLLHLGIIYNKIFVVIISERIRK